MFARGDVLELLQALPSPPQRLRFLCPFDPLIRDRLRTHRIFDFHYRIEVFVPAAQRRHGYYVLPVLEGDRFIGRIDLKHHRQVRTLQVISLWLEPGQRFTKSRQRDLSLALDRLRRFIGADTVTFENGYLRG
jgi:uncharacterized protein YcaQ